MDPAMSCDSQIIFKQMLLNTKTIQSMQRKLKVKVKIYKSSNTYQNLIIKNLFCLLAFNILALWIAPGSYAADSKNPYSKGQTEVVSEFKTQTVNKCQQLPDFPQYSGQSEFISGFICPNAKGGVQITYNISVRENKQTVLQWYQDALRVYKWDLRKPNSTAVSATKGGTYVNIMVSPASRSGMLSDIMISYRTTTGH